MEVLMKFLKTIVPLSSFLFLLGCSSADSAQPPAVPASINTAEQTQTVSTAGTVQTSDIATVTETTATPEILPAAYSAVCADMLTEVPPPEILEQREGVPYPAFQKYTYYSQTAERETGVNVLLPYGYSPDRQYPVLYVLHGSADTEDWMARDEVHIATMLTNLIMDGEAEEMIVVSPYIYCSKDTPRCYGLSEQDFLNFDNFINDLETDLKPFIEERFSVDPDRSSNAITGFSIGGRESLYIGFSHPEQFGYIGSICTASGVVDGTGHPCALREEEFQFSEGQEPYLLLLSAAEQDAAVGLIPFKYDEILTENGTEHLMHRMTQSGHDVNSVISHLYNFMRMIFHQN